MTIGAISLPRLEAVRQLSTTKAVYSDELLAAAELLVGDAGAAPADRHAPRLVMQWAVEVLSSSLRSLTKNQTQIDEMCPLTAERMWKVCQQALETPLPPGALSLASGLPLSGTMGLLHSIAWVVLSSHDEPPPDGTSHAAVRVFAALTGQPYPPTEAFSLGDAGNGLPQVKLEQFGDVLAEIVQSLVARPKAPGAPDLAALALMHFAAMRSRSGNQRKTFGVLVTRVLRPLLIMQHHPNLMKHRPLRRAVEVVINEVLFHKDHLDGLKSILCSGGSQRRKGPSEAAAPDASAEVESQGADWTAYQHQLLTQLEGWLSVEQWGREESYIAKSLGPLLRTFVRRLTATSTATSTAPSAAERANAAHAEAQGAQAATVGVKRKQPPAATQGIGPSAQISRPAFTLAVRLWKILWKPRTENEQGKPPDGDEVERAARLAAARALLDAVQQLEIYQYDSNLRAGGQFHSLKTLFTDLLASCESHGSAIAVGQTGNGEGSSVLMVEAMDNEVRCLSLAVKIDHRVLEGCLLTLLGLLGSRVMALGEEERGGEGSKKTSASRHMIHAANSCRSACLRAVTEVVETYARLRELQALLDTAIQAAQRPGVNALLAHTDVTRALTRALEECPPPQLPGLWNLLDPEFESGDAEEAQGVEGVLLQPGPGGHARAQIFSVFLKSLRITAANAEEMGKRAATSMGQIATWISSVTHTSEKRESDGEMPDQARALELYANLVDVLIVCSYWLGDDNVMSSSGPSSFIQRFMPPQGNEQCSLEHIPTAYKVALDRIAVGRLRQLQLEASRRRLGQSADRVAAAQEINTLVQFLFERSTKHTNRDGSDTPRGPTIDVGLLGTSLPFWAPYARAEDLDSFWRAVLSPSEGSDGVTRALFADASFYELTPLATRLMPVWCEMVVTAALGRMLGKGDEPPLKQVAQLLALPIEELAAAVAGMLKGGGDGDGAGAKIGRRLGKVLAKGRAPEVADLLRMLHLVKLVNALPYGYIPREAQAQRFLVSGFLASCMWRVLKTVKSDDAAAAGISSVMPHLCLALHTCALEGLKGDTQGIVRLVASHLPLKRWIVDAGWKAEQHAVVGRDVARTLKAIGLNLLGQYLRCLIEHEDGKGVKQLVDLVEPHAFGALDGNALHGPRRGEVAMVLDDADVVHEEQEDGAAYALRVLSELVGPYVVEDESLVAGVAGREHVVSLMKKLAECLVEPLRDLRPDALRLHAKLLKLGDHGAALPVDVLDGVLSRVKEQKQAPHGFMEFLATFLGESAVVAQGMSEEKCGDILVMIVELEMGGRGDGSHAVCDAIRAAVPVVAERAVRRLAELLGEGVHKGDWVAFARGCALLTQLAEAAEPAVEGEVPAPVLHGHEREVLEHTLQALPRLVTEIVCSAQSSDRQEQPQDQLQDKVAVRDDRTPSRAATSALCAALELIRTYMRKRRLLRPRVDDIICVLNALSSVPLLFSGVQGGRSMRVRGNIAEETLSTLASTLDAMLKQHARCVHTCTPPFFSLTRTLFRVVISGDVAGQRACKAWVRLVEHMAGHPAALRKHLMLVLADYVAVSPTLQPATKAVLLPAAYAVMDALTTFEMQHLHAAVVDSAGQAVLKKLHSDYQLQHKYRGKV